jgi:hypothetical protein
MAAATLLGLCAGCAHLPPCPAKGGPAWSAWTSPHFQLLTDVTDEAAAERLATELEQFRAALVAAAWPDAPEPARPLEVIALRDAFETAEVLPPHVDAEFVALGGLDFILASATEHFGRAKTLKHETVHGLMHQLGLDRNAPVWFAEGIAEYLAMTELDEETHQISFGAIDPDYLASVHQSGLAGWHELWAPNAGGMEKWRQVATAWLLVHYLFNQQRERFHRYQSGLAAAKDAQAYWLEVFPELTPTGLYDRLSAYASSGEYVKYVFKIPRPHFAFVQQSVSDAEVHAVFGLLRWSAAGRDRQARAAARQEIGEALRLDGMNLRARFVERVLMGNAADDVAMARALTLAHPNDWRAWLILGVAHANRRQPVELEAALVRARALGYQDRSDLRPSAAAPY